MPNERLAALMTEAGFLDRANTIGRKNFARAVTANTPLAGAAEFGAVLLDRAKGIAEQLGTGEATQPSDSDRLRRAGEDLLRRSRDVWHEEERHPAFEGILRSIAPDEARMLVLLLKEGPQPTVDVIVSNSKRVIAGGLSMVAGRASLRSPESMPTYLVNLTRLGLVWESDEPVKDLLRYQVVEAQPDDSTMRTNLKWATWAEAEAKKA